MNHDNTPVDAGTSFDITVAAVKTALRALEYGCQTPDDIAAKLLDMGCHGWRLQSKTCPLAQYLRIELVNDAVSVSQTRIRVRYHIVDDAVVWPSELIRGFIAMFDAGMYPELSPRNGGA